MWITNGTTDGRTTGDVFLVYARTGPGRRDVSMFLVEKVANNIGCHILYSVEKRVQRMIAVLALRAGNGPEDVLLNTSPIKLNVPRLGVLVCKNSS